MWRKDDGGRRGGELEPHSRLRLWTSLADGVELLESGETRLMILTMLVHSVVGDRICGVNHNFRALGGARPTPCKAPGRGRVEDGWVSGQIRG
jgi:hypothetical protein